MTPKQKLELERIEVRRKLNELGGVADPSEEQRQEVDELVKQLDALEVRAKAFVAAEDEPEETTSEGEPEDRELVELRKRSNIGEIFTAAVGHSSAEGATRELQQHYGLDDSQIPLDLIEERAVTPAPADVGQNQAAIIPGVFPQSAHAFLGIDTPRVGVGEAVYPVLTTNATAHTPAEGAAVAETTGSFSADVLSPSRIQASFFYSREDRARFAGMAEALRENLSMALQDKLDQQILAGTSGLLAGSNLTKVAASAVTDFAGYRSGFVYDRIDGTYASMASDMKIVCGADAYAHMSETYRGNNADDSALDSVMRISGGVKVSAHVPAVASDKQNAVVRRGMRRDMVAPIWEGITLISDEITKASTGEIVITEVMIHAVKILRSAGFAKVESQHA